MTAGTYGCFELAGLFAVSAQKEAKQYTIDSRGTALITQAQYRERAPDAWETGSQLQTYQTLGSEIPMVLRYSTLRPIYELHDSVDSQH